MQGISVRNPVSELRNYAKNADFLREALCMSADLTGVTWAGVERGERIITHEEINSIAKALKISLAELFTNT